MGLCVGGWQFGLGDPTLMMVFPADERPSLTTLRASPAWRSATVLAVLLLLASACAIATLMGGTGADSVSGVDEESSDDVVHDVIIQGGSGEQRGLQQQQITGASPLRKRQRIMRDPSIETYNPNEQMALQHLKRYAARPLSGFTLAHMQDMPHLHALERMSDVCTHASFASSEMHALHACDMSLMCTAKAAAGAQGSPRRALHARWCETPRGRARCLCAREVRPFLYGVAHPYRLYRPHAGSAS